MSKRTVTRRHFLGAAASVSAFTLAPSSILGGSAHAAPSEKLHIAGIGVGAMGAGNLGQMNSENIVALCDVDFDYAAHTFKRYPQAKTYRDYRDMLDRQKDIDAVVVATPDHTHAVISMAAIKAGKHVYCQKPLTHDVYEARMLTLAAREAGVATQMGIQGHSRDDNRSICEWIWSGAIGEVREVVAWCSLTYYPWGHASWSSQWGARPTETSAVPEKLDWDLWIGPAPMRPYHRAYHPKTWRCWWDFGSGMMGDRGAHTLDPVFWALKLGAPERVEATSCAGSEDVHPLSAVVTYKFPARGELPPVKLSWYEGMRPPRPEALDDDESMGDREGGVLFLGTKGIITCGTYGNAGRLIPKSLMRDFTPPPKTLPRVPDSHEQDWVRACKSGQPAGANFDYSGPLTEVCALGNVAKRMDAPIDWDEENLKVTNRPEANRFVRIPYRKGWSL